MTKKTYFIIKIFDCNYDKTFQLPPEIHAAEARLAAEGPQAGQREPDNLLSRCQDQWLCRRLRRRGNEEYPLFILSISDASPLMPLRHSSKGAFGNNASL